MENPVAHIVAPSTVLKIIKKDTELFNGHTF